MIVGETFPFFRSINLNNFYASSRNLFLIPAVFFSFSPPKRFQVTIIEWRNERENETYNNNKQNWRKDVIVEWRENGEEKIVEKIRK